MNLLEQKEEDLRGFIKNAEFIKSDENIQHMKSQLAKIHHILRLWHELEDIPMNPETECLDAAFTPTDETNQNIMTRFEPGTSKYDIWHWFESEFNISIGRDLME